MSSSFQQFGHLRIPLEDIVSATNHFADENLIGKGDFGKAYKGQLLRFRELINIVARRYNRLGDARFWTEISILSHLNHKNIVSIVGFCDENGKNIIIDEHAVHGSLDKYLSGPTLTWMQRLQICLGAARALSFLHFNIGCSYGVIHRDIKSRNILLDENWEAKVCGFGLSIATQRHRLLLSPPCGTLGYIDPVYNNTRSLTDKSDVYSFGVLLFEVLCGREAVIREHNGRRQFLVSMATEHYEHGKLEEIIDPDLRKQMDPQSFNIFSETAYHCLSGQRSQRPDMEKVVKRLEKALQLQRKHENPVREHSTTPVVATSSNHLKGKNLEHFRIRFNDLVLATDNFTKNCIGSGTYGAVYKAELEYFDNKSFSAIERKNIDELPRRRGSVAIKRIFSRQDEQGEQGFFSEIEMLSNCKHRNIVSLLGFCDEEPQRILVYDLASNGSLDDYLGNTDSMIILTWTQRIKICLDIAYGLNYLHTTMEDKERIIHRDIKSANILLYENWEAKIADFGLSRFHPTSTINTYNIAGTEVYLDPEYLMTGKLKKESDTYSFGVILFEILCGRLAYDEVYNVGDDKGLPSIVRRCFDDGTLKEMVDPKLKEETENKFTLKRGPNQDSLDTFSKIGYRCLVVTQAERPTMEVVINELEKALYFQENSKDNLRISLEDIKLATQNFSVYNVIAEGGFWKVYKGEVPQVNGHSIIAVKRWDKRRDKRSGQGEHEFLTELEILFEYKHEKVIGLVGYCDELGERIIVYEYASRGSLDRYLKDDHLTWIKRLEICIDVASGLDFLHGTNVKQEVVIHKDIKSTNILLNEEWKAKITDFGHSLICPIFNQKIDYLEDAVGKIGYLDPLYYKSRVLTKESDIYSLGVVFFEILWGRLVVTENDLLLIRQYLMEFDEHNFHKRWLNKMKFDGRLQAMVSDGRLEKQVFNGRLQEMVFNERLNKMVFEGIKEQIVRESLITYSMIAYQCLNDDREKRPTTSEVLVQLKKALEFQLDHEVWKAKLPADYKQIIQMSNSPEIYSLQTKKDLYTIFSKGILLQKGKVWFSLGNNGERNEMISAREFSYKHRRSPKWRSISKSRFPRVAKMLNISNLNIQIHIKTQFLSLDVIYGVHVVFKFCDSRKVSSKPMYVNLTYKMGNKTFHAYFATLREDGWMMIELCRFLNHKEDVDFEVLLESFSRCYCGSGAIYVEGIEFRAVDNPKEVQRFMTSNSSLDTLQNLEKSKHNVPDASKEEPCVLIPKCIPFDEGEKFSQNKVDEKKCHMLPAEVVLYDFSNEKFFQQSRFQVGIEVLSQQVLGIKCKIEIQKLSLDTEYVCYLVFKLSEKCRGLHCPVKVRDMLHWKNKENGILYFRSPSPWNLHDTHHVPEKREDGWMEVTVWKFNSTHDLRNGSIPINLKLISYKGTMSGLIVSGLEIRPM